ncbi:FecR family protein [Fodinibius halophilus]|uniref:Uncharacterized protein n=1 Tax=Fodinibius halophilus TaxID=1736908 RepID=A0A6M1TJG2_9BACT|nr:FecR domain-containing protein [Fodinibius halophilus]NGP88740.1 hypothetical protein [Fodinibius halophilus]
MGDQQSHNDPDSKRAEFIKKAREQNIPLAELDDDFIQELAEYVETKKDESPSFEADKKEVWNNINAATQQADKVDSTANITTIFSSSTVRWAAAAILIVGLLSGAIYMQFFAQQKRLLAQSTSTITTITLDDGSTVTLRPHSRLYTSDNSKILQSYHLEGEAFFEVTKQNNRTFSVTTDIGKVSVLGTRFNLSSWGEQLQVYLEEGSVEVKPSDRENRVILKPGESATLASAKATPNKTVANAEEFTDWIDGELIFNDKSVQQIAAELEQQFGITVLLPNPVAQQQLTGRLSLDKVNTALEDLELALNGTFTQTGDSRYTFEPNSQ